MKRKTILALITVCILSFASCGKQETSATTEFITATVESAQAETTAPEEAEESKTDSLPWLQLSSLETYPELRAAFEELIGITGTTGNKEGILYYDPATQAAEQNVTLYMATKNSAMSVYFTNIGQLESISKMAADNYTDVDVDDANAPYATINAYFELLPDQEDGQFDGDATISRAQTMALLMRATTQVNEAQAPDEDADFTKAVGETQYTNFAAPMNEYAYLNTSTGLNEQSFNDTMTKGEFIALVTNYIRADYVSTLGEWGYTDLYSDASDVIISTVSDAGDIKYSEAISDASKGVPTDMYNTFKLAIKNGYLAEADLEDWDSALTKAEAISVFLEMATNYTSNIGNTLYSQYKTPTTDTSSSETLSESGEIMQSKWADINGAWDAVHQFTLYAREQGADYTDGWCWCYDHGKGAGDQPSYAVYMKEGDPLYGTIYHVGDYLPDGTQFSGTNDEWDAFIKQDFRDRVEADGYDVYDDPDGDGFIIDLDGSYNPNN